MNHYPTLEEILDAEDHQIVKWCVFLAFDSDRDRKDLRKRLIDLRYFIIPQKTRKEIHSKVGSYDEKCEHPNQFLKVVDACVTCETVATICQDCRMVLDQNTDC